MAKFILNRRWFLSGTAVAMVAMGWGMNLGVAAAGEKDVRRRPRVLLFSGTGWYRHPEIPQCNCWLVRTLGEAGCDVDVTETPVDLTPARVAS